MSMVRSLLVNTGSNLGVMAVKLAITFVMTPIFIRNIGRYDYGIWEVLGAVLGYMGLLDVGLRPALSRYAAYYRAGKDHRALEEVYATALVFMSLLGITTALALMLWGVLLPQSLLERDGGDAGKYTVLLCIVGLQLGASFPGAVAESYLEGFQKYYLKNNITIVNSLLGSAVIWFFITPANGLLLLALVNSIGLVSKYIMFHFIVANLADSRVRFHRQRVSIGRLREMLVFGGKSLVQGVSTRIEVATDSLVIGWLLGPAMVPLYSIPANLVGYLRTFTYTITHALMPIFSQMSANNENDLMRDVYLRCSRLAVAAVLPLAAGVVLLGGPFIGLWLGPDFRTNSDAIIALLVFFTALPGLNPFCSRYLTAINEHGIFAKLTPISATANLIISIALAKPYGILGVAMGSALPVVVFVPLYLRKCCRHLDISVRHYLRSAVMPSLGPALLMATVVLSLRFTGLLDSYMMLALTAAVGAVVYGISGWHWILAPDERSWIVGAMRSYVRAGQV